MMHALRSVSPPAEYLIGVALQNRGVRTDFWRAFESVSVAAEFAFAMVWEVIGGATYPIAIWRDGKRIWQPTHQHGRLYFLATAAALRELSRGGPEEIVQPRRSAPQLDSRHPARSLCSADVLAIGANSQVKVSSGSNGGAGTAQRTRRSLRS